MFKDLKQFDILKHHNFDRLKKSRGVHRKNTYKTHPGHERQQKVTMIVLCRVAYLQFRSRRTQEIGMSMCFNPNLIWPFHNLG